jgi:hypothetical protein
MLSQPKNACVPVAFVNRPLTQASVCPGWIPFLLRPEVEDHVQVTVRGFSSSSNIGPASRHRSRSPAHGRYQRDSEGPLGSAGHGIKFVVDPHQLTKQLAQAPYQLSAEPGTGDGEGKGQEGVKAH